MPVNIDEVISDVTAEPPQAAAPGAADSDEPEKMRKLYERLLRDFRRTAAEGFDD